MTALLTWRVLRYALPAAVLLALLATLLLYRAADLRHIAELTVERQALATSIANVTALESQIHDQNAAVDAMAAKSDAASKAAAVASARADEREKALAGTMDKLRASAAVAHVSGAPCTISPALMMAEGEL